MTTGMRDALDVLGGQVCFLPWLAARRYARAFRRATGRSGSFP